MAGVTVAEELERNDRQGGRGGRGGGDSFSGGDGREGASGVPAVPQRTYVTGMTVALAGILMFFMALTSAYIVRKGISLRLAAVSPAASSPPQHGHPAIEQCGHRSRSKLSETRGFSQLSPLVEPDHGTRSALSSPDSSSPGGSLPPRASISRAIRAVAFSTFSLPRMDCTCLEGLCALLYVGLRSARMRHLTLGTASEVVSIYWHFMDGLWVFLSLTSLLGTVKRDGYRMSTSWSPLCLVGRRVAVRHQFEEAGNVAVHRLGLADVFGAAGQLRVCAACPPRIGRGRLRFGRPSPRPR